jgi:pimeloyl-ACP methyl ester carboxylesterase
MQSPQSQSLDINGQRIAYLESAGAGPAIVFLHGNSCSAKTFLPQFDALGDKYHLIAMDLPGHGDSADAENPEAWYVIPGYANALRGLVEQLGVENAVFVGWSLGGHIVLEAAPDLKHAKGFLIYGAPPLAFPPDMANAFLPHPAMAAGFTADLTQEQMDAYVTAFFKPGVTELPEQYRADVKRTDGRARVTMAAGIRPDGYRDEVQIVAALTQPLAIVQGEQEQLVNSAYFATLNMPTLWHGALQIIPDAGHAPHSEQPEKFNAVLDTFVTECNA